MPRTRRRCLVSLLATAALVAVSAGAASAAPIHSASAFNPKGIYDCSVLQAATGIRVYVTTFVFKSHHRYGNGLKGPGNTLAKSVSNGKYKLSGSKIIPLSGRLKQLHESLLIQRNDLAVLDSRGRFTSLGCFQRQSTQTQTPTPTPAPTGGGPAFPVGTYDCYHTGQQTNGSFSQVFASDITFWSDGTYTGPIRGPAWNQQGTTINFTAGGLWDDVNHRHDVGQWFPNGTSMPNSSGTFAGNQYTLVLRSTQPNEANPPMNEFTGPVPSSFYYCKMRA